MEFVDSHTHLDFEAFDADREEVIQRALAAGVTRLVNIGAGFKEQQAAVKLAEQYPFIWAVTGMHPASCNFELDEEWLKRSAQHPRVVGLGETGLDFYWDETPRERQYEWFEAHIRVACELRKPLVIHSRLAGKECLEVLSRTSAREVGGVFHCYSENADFEKKLRDLNFYVSFPGPVTFKKAHDVREAVSQIPLERMLIETDSPYLAPEPYRGKRCESAYVVHTAKMIAQVKGVSLQEVADVTTNNAIKLFRLS